MDFTINNQQKQNLFFWYNIIVKEKQMKNKTLQRVYKMLKPQTKAIIIISILSIIINIGEVIKPYLIKIVMDDYLSSGLWQKGIISIGIIGSIYIAIVLIGNILDFIVTNNLFLSKLALTKVVSYMFPIKSATKTLFLIPLQIVTSLLKSLIFLITFVLKLYANKPLSVPNRINSSLIVSAEVIFEKENVVKSLMLVTSFCASIA